jgi:hypothetical protein
MIEDYINSYIESKIIITGNNNDYILSCHIKYDLDISYQSISKTLLKNKSIKKKIMKGSMYYIGLKYK